MKVNNNLDMNNCQIIRVIIDNVSDFPTEDLKPGRIIYHETNQKYYFYNGTDWIEMSSGSEIDVESFPGYIYNKGTTENDKQISIYSITQGSTTTAQEELAKSNSLVSAKQVASTLSNLTFFLDPNKYWDKGHSGFIISDTNGKLKFLDTEEMANTYKYIDNAIAQKEMIPKVKQDGDATGYAYVVDNAWAVITPSEVWSDVIPTSGCVVNNIKKISSNILNYRTTDNISSLLAINKSDSELYLYTPSSNSVSPLDERIITTTQDTTMQSTRKIVDSMDVLSYDDAWVSVYPDIPVLDDCIPTVGAVRDAIASLSDGSIDNPIEEDTNSIATPFIIDSDEKLIEWLTGQVDIINNDVRYVYIKSGNYLFNESTTSGILNLDSIGTHRIYAEPGTNIDINLTNIDSAIFTIDEMVMSEYDFSIEGLNINILGLHCLSGDSNIHVMKNLKNISNCNIKIHSGAIFSSSGIFENCTNINNCSIHGHQITSVLSNPESQLVLFNNCQNINNMIIDIMVVLGSDSINFDNYRLNIFNECENIQNLDILNCGIFVNDNQMNLGTNDISLINNCKNITNVNLSGFNIEWGTFDTSILMPKEESIEIAFIYNSSNISNVYLKENYIMNMNDQMKYYIISNSQNISNCDFNGWDADPVAFENRPDNFASIINSQRITGCNCDIELLPYRRCKNILMSQGYFTDCYSINSDMSIENIDRRFSADNTAEGGFNFTLH